METLKLIVGIILLIIGLLFFFNNKNIGRAAHSFYKKFYTEKNLTILFKILGVILFLGGLGLILIN
jgi:hypothetical protein